jgi:hypothetical protein
VAAASVYRLPVPVQPLKAFGAIAIAKGLGQDEIAAGALLMGLIFLTAGRLGLVDLAGRAFPRALVRGVQLTVGLLFLKIAWGLAAHPPKGFRDYALSPGLAIPLAVAGVLLALTLRRRLVSLAFVAIGIAAMLALAGGKGALGPSAIHPPSWNGHVLWDAFTVLVLAQVPLTFANSCLATADAARSYFGERAAERVRPGRLASTLGTANLFSAAISGMPVCHGAGGMTAHYAFGARTGGAPLALGSALVAVALAVGSGLGALLAAFPLTILAALLATAGLLHIALLRDLRGVRQWGLALVVGIVGFEVNLGLALALGLALWWIPRGALRLRGALAPG